jgi:hypothetical protein
MCLCVSSRVCAAHIPEVMCPSIRASIRFCKLGMGIVMLFTGLVRVCACVCVPVQKEAHAWPLVLESDFRGEDLHVYCHTGLLWKKLLRGLDFGFFRIFSSLEYPLSSPIQ